MFWQTSLAMVDVLRWVAITLGLGISSWAGIGLWRRWMLHHKILDIPNERSSHAAPTPHGAGAVVILLTLLTWLGLLIKHAAPWLDYAVLAAAAGVAVISALDDRAHISFKWRLLAHGAAAAVAVMALPDAAAMFQDWLPLWLERTLLAIGLVWFMNLFNFMDGIDGMMGTLIVTLALGISLVTPTWLDWQLSLSLVPIAAGFLVWNWMPAKIFSGDVGSVAVGYLIGWLLLRLSLTGNYIPAIILAAYPIADTTFTLLRRISQGEKFWEPHRRHFFQKAVRSGMTHAAVVRVVWALQVFMIVMAVWATYRKISPSVLGILAVTCWLGFCQWRFKYFDGKDRA